MSTGELIAAIGGAVAIVATLATGLTFILGKVWKGSAQTARWDERVLQMEGIGAQIKDAVGTELSHLNETLRAELGHIAEEVMLLRQSKGEQGELLARTVTMVYELEKRMDRWDRAHPAP